MSEQECNVTNMNPTLGAMAGCILPSASEALHSRSIALESRNHRTVYYKVYKNDVLKDRKVVFSDGDVE